LSVTFYPNMIQHVGFAAADEPSVTTQNYACSGGETTGAAYDCVDNRRTNQLTVDTNGEGTDFHIELDLTSSLTADFCIIDNHNLNTATGLFSIQQGGADVIPTSSYSGTLGGALAADGIDAFEITPVADGIVLAKFTSSADAGWDLLFLDVAGTNFGADCLFGELCLGTSFAPAFSPELQPTFDYDMPGSSFNESDSGQRYGFSTHTNKRRAWKMTWKYMSDANKASLETIFLYTRGVKNPFYIDLGESATPHLYYVRFMRGLSFKGLTKDAWQVDMFIEEEL